MEKSFFFNDNTAYSANDWCEYFRFLSDGVFVNLSVDALMVSKISNSMQVSITGGSAQIQGVRYICDGAVLTIEAPAAESRIDRIVLRLNLMEGQQGVKVAVKQGVPATLPQAPLLQRDNTIYELSLATVTIPAGAVTLNGAYMIDDRYNTDLCGPVSFLGEQVYGVPTGTILWHGAEQPPAGWLACDGSAVGRLQYPRLFATIGVIYGKGDGNTTFNLPDLRNEFIRGLTTGRTIGSKQDATHFNAGEYAVFGAYQYEDEERIITQNFGGGQGSYREGKSYQIRPNNIALLPIIKY